MTKRKKNNPSSSRNLSEFEFVTTDHSHMKGNDCISLLAFQNWNRAQLAL